MVKKPNTYTVLTQPDMENLMDYISTRGNLADMVRKTGLNVGTIKRAKDGCRVEEITAKIISHYLTKVQRKS